MISIERAIAISATAHDGQKDKAGEPYIWHPIRVAMSCDTEHAQIVAILHDVAEDTSVTLDQLKDLFMDERGIQDALDCLTHRRYETYEDYVGRVGSNALATTVKLADLHDNMDLSRLQTPTEKDWKRYQKYVLARDYLQKRPQYRRLV